MGVRLAAEVKRRRGELGKSQRALAASRHVSVATLGAVERGELREFNTTTLAGLDRALGWEIGHAQRILNEEKAHAETIGDGSPDRVIDSLTTLLADYRTALEHIHPERPPKLAALLKEAEGLDDDDLTFILELVRRMRGR